MGRLSCPLSLFPQVADYLQNMLRLEGRELLQLPREILCAAGRKDVRVKKFPGRYVKVFADIQKSRHGGQRPAVFDLVDIAGALPQERLISRAETSFCIRSSAILSGNQLK